MKPTIAWLVNGLAGTGGGRITMQITERLRQKGHPISIYSLDGTNWAHETTVPCLPLTDFRGADVVICSDMGRGYKVFETFEKAKGRKFWYHILLTSEFRPVFDLPKVTHIASTPYFFRYLTGYGCQDVVLLTGPSDVENFYPAKLQYRNNVVLMYLKKASWVGPRAAKLAWLERPRLVLGGLGFVELSKDQQEKVWEEGVPFVDFSVESHLLDFLRVIFRKSGMYVEVCGASAWGFNYTLSEAMACGCPVVSTDYEGFDHLVVDGETALAVPGCEAREEEFGQNWLVRPDPKRVAERIVELHDDAALRDRLSKNALDQVRKYNLSDWVGKFASLIEE